MSQYLNFYLKSKNGEFLPIGIYSRCSKIYHVGFDYAPYEKGKSMTEDTFRYIFSDINDNIKNIETSISNIDNMISSVKDFNNTIEEKTDAIYSYIENKNELKEEYDEWIRTRYFYEFLNSIFNEVDLENYIYFGVEWNPNYEGE